MGILHPWREGKQEVIPVLLSLPRQNLHSNKHLLTPKFFHHEKFHPSFLFVVAALTASFYCAAQITGTAQVCAGQVSLHLVITWYPHLVSILREQRWSPEAALHKSHGCSCRNLYCSATDGDTESYTVNVYAIPAPHMQYVKNPCNVSDSDSAGGGGILRSAIPFV